MALGEKRRGDNAFRGKPELRAKFNQEFRGIKNPQQIVL